MSAPDDPHEREADQVADRVMRMPDHQAIGERPNTSAHAIAIQRKCKACEQEDERTGSIALARQAAGTERPGRDRERSADSEVDRVLAGSGRPLDPDSRHEFEQRFGSDFSRVRIHTGSTAGRAAAALHAKAFTVGAHIGFAPAQYAPRSLVGRRLLAHELTHVVQQGQAPALRRSGGPPLVASAGAGLGVQRSEGDDPDLLKQLEDEKTAANEEANQDVDLMARAHGARLAFLYKMFRHPKLTSQKVLDDFVEEMQDRSTNELDTLAREDNPYTADFALEQAPKGFPLTWAARIRWRLSLGVDPPEIVKEWAATFDALKKAAKPLGNEIFEHGLPVALDDPGRLRNFHLRVADAKATNSSKIADYAKQATVYTKLKWLSVFALMWEKSVDGLSDSIEAGDIVVDPKTYQDWVDKKQAKLQAIPGQVRERVATEQEIVQIQTDAVSLDEAAIAIGMASALVSIVGILSGWKDASDLFDAAISKADELVGGSSGGERIVAALRWAHANSYFSGAAAEWAENLIAHGPQILAEIAAILILGMIPGADIAVAVYLALTMARDVVNLIDELGGAMNECISATDVASLQAASMRLARVLTNGAIFILIVLVTEGIGKAAARLKAEASRLREADKTLTEEAARKQAMKKLPPEERAALEQGPIKLAKKFEREIGSACSLGSIVCRTKLPDQVEKEAGKYPTAGGVPKPDGPFKVQKAALAGVQRGTENLRTIARENRASWPAFDKALKAAEKAGKDWPVDASGVPWEVHHIKPVFMGGTNAPENLMPLPKGIHQKYTNWWNAVHRAFKKRFSEAEWDQIYKQGKKVQGSRVPKTSVR